MPDNYRWLALAICNGAPLLGQMSGWSIHLFRIRGIPLSVHITFLLLLGYAGWEGWIAQGLPGAVWGLLTLISFFAVVVLHELGHAFMAMHYRIRVRRILLMPIGGMAELEAIPREPGRELMITAAGPAVNFALAVLLWFSVDFPRGWLTGLTPANVTELLRVLFLGNIAMLFLNLLPVFPMDGGRILRAGLAYWLPYVQATGWAARVGQILSVLGALAMIFWFNDYLGAALFLFIFYVGDREYRFVKQQDRAEQAWRESRGALIRIHEPPLLREPPRLER